MEETVAVVLAAGKGTRMRSRCPKVLQAIAERPMLAYVLDAVSQLSCSRTIVVVGFQAEAVRAALSTYRVMWVEQREQLGTGHALLQVRPVVEGDPVTLLVVPGDVPLVRARTLMSLTMAHKESGAAATILTALLTNPTGYGRVVRDADDMPLRIVEERDADRSVRQLPEVNTGIYAFSSSVIFEVLGRIEPHNVQQEYYLTDAISLLRVMGFETNAVLAGDAEEVTGVNTVEDLKAVEGVLRKRAASVQGRQVQPSIQS